MAEPNEKEENLAAATINKHCFNNSMKAPREDRRNPTKPHAERRPQVLGNIRRRRVVIYRCIAMSGPRDIFDILDDPNLELAPDSAEVRKIISRKMKELRRTMKK